MKRTAYVYSEAAHYASCRSFDARLSELNVRRTPKRVLIVPLLSRDPHTTESPRWSEQPARTLGSFYRKRFNAVVTQMHDVWSWGDYYRQVEQMEGQSKPFDRVIFISHGGFDGPVLKNTVFWHDLQISGGKGKLVQFSEAQPGLKNALSIEYDLEKNRVFTDYMASRWRDLAPLRTAEIWQLLKGMEMRLQPLDRECYQRYCSRDKLAASPEHLRSQRTEICERTCREALFQLKTSAEISSERFFHFTTSLNSLAARDGLIFFGTCNPGSAAPEKKPKKDETEFLINSTLAGGPHRTYVHLVSAATGHVTAGPIGNSSAEDIVNRIILFESNRPQRNLCVVEPATK
ncbi:MAG: hypothetical protein ACU83V_00635 [Gammaproteobacteria bacterium]